MIIVTEVRRVTVAATPLVALSSRHLYRRVDRLRQPLKALRQSVERTAATGVSGGDAHELRDCEDGTTMTRLNGSWMQSVSCRKNGSSRLPSNSNNLSLQCLSSRGGASMLRGATRGFHSEVLRVDTKELVPGDLLSRLTKPTVLTGLTEHWPARHCWSTSYLCEVHGDIMVPDLRLPEALFESDDVDASKGNALYADHLRNAYVPFVRMPEKVSLREFIRNRFCDYYFEISEFGAAGRLCLDAFGGLDGLPDVFAADDLSQLTFGLGPAGDGVALHAHTAAWNALMFGEKDWYFYKPNALFGWSYDSLALLESRALPAATELVARNTDKAPPELMRCRQRPGEVVFVPDGWWHATFSHTTTACLGGQRHKDRLPGNWGESLLQQWPGCGLAAVAVAKERRDHALFEEAIRMEPFNSRFALEYIEFLSAGGEGVKAAEVALRVKETMKVARRRRLLSRPEFAAIIAQLAERLYLVVESVAAATSVAVAGARDCKSSIVSERSPKELFADMLHVSRISHALVGEALRLDPGAPVALNVAQAIQMRAQSANVQSVPHGLL
eukprot:TRINITY_DN21958_c0_g2_i1.p1 TRINITY_DN21958_c0_g2~~TRINITY_DN21958_c0_g2_i1.p1  ORF type:complete len:558 (-),score=73.30 TRINITY_DN21958_c0_g2_i1:15-1688(-)